MQASQAKYDKLSKYFSASDYAGADLLYFMRRRVDLSFKWGKPLQLGDSLIEFGCGDGVLAKIFIERELSYCGVDYSQGMIEQASARLSEFSSTKKLKLLVGDVSQFTPAEPVDAIVAYMRTFFHYDPNPLTTLKRLRPFVRKKIILDFNPRQISITHVCKILKEAGFQRVEWRGFFVPSNKKPPVALLDLLGSLETFSPFARLLLRFKFNALVKGEV